MNLPKSLTFVAGYLSNGVGWSEQAIRVEPFIYEQGCYSLELESWLQGMVSVPERSPSLYDNVTSLLFDPGDDNFRNHWFWVNDITEPDEYIEDTDRSVRTIGY